MVKGKGLSQLDAEAVVSTSSPYKGTAEVENAAKKYTLKLKFVRISTEKPLLRSFSDSKSGSFFMIYFCVFLFCAK